MGIKPKLLPRGSHNPALPPFLGASCALPDSTHYTSHTASLLSSKPIPASGSVATPPTGFRGNVAPPRSLRSRWVAGSSPHPSIPLLFRFITTTVLSSCAVLLVYCLSPCMKLGIGPALPHNLFPARSTESGLRKILKTLWDQSVPSGHVPPCLSFPIGQMSTTSVADAERTRGDSLLPPCSQVNKHFCPRDQ